MRHKKGKKKRGKRFLAS
jgi:hypothetical protein